MEKSGSRSGNCLCGKLQAGQILLIVILVVIVSLTIGLSIASRSITSLKASTEETESRKALAAAEAGIERAIQGNVPIAIIDQLPNNSNYETKISPVNTATFLINGGNAIPKDEGTDVWFIGHNSTDGSLNYDDYSSTSPGSLNLYWGLTSDPCKEAAIQAVVITRTQSNVVNSYRYIYDPCRARQAENNFTSVATGNFTINGVTFKYSTPVNDLASGISGNKNIILMRVIPVYKDSVVGLSTCSSLSDCSSSTPLPSQGYLITSTGVSGQANRKLTVFKGFPQAYLPYLSYGLFVAN